MKLGYPSINRSIGCTANSTFRLASYSEELLIEKVANNLQCLQKILEFNVQHNLLFFRISSDLVPFASHPICRFDWETYFASTFSKIGDFIKRHEMRISMHPDQFNVLSSLDEGIVRRSIAELNYHRRVLESLGLDQTAKVQIHLGGSYGNKGAALQRFVDVYRSLEGRLRSRLVIENDDRIFDLRDCLAVHERIEIPIVFDTFHHECLNRGETLREGMILAHGTWSSADGIPIVDYSSQEPGKRKGAHATTARLDLFAAFLHETRPLDFDIMLEIKDKEKSALRCIYLIEELERRRPPK